MADAIAYLAAAAVCVPVASRLGLGAVLGYLGAGVILGPFVTGIFDDVEATLHFAELGVVLMLFVIGLELEPSRLAAMRKAVFGGGSVQMAACGLATSIVGVAVGLPITSAIVVALSIALSSTAIAVQTMRERGILQTPTGQAAFGVLLFQDIAAIPLVAIVPLLGTGGAESGDPQWLAITKVIAAIVAVVVVGRFAVQPVLRFVAKTGLRDVFTASTLLLVLAIAQLMSMVGLSMALGAFLAGVLLASSEYRHALETDIEPFKGLLMGLFFVAVGMSIDLGLLAARPLFVLLLVVGYIGAKSIALWLVARRIGVPKDQAPMFAALLAQGGEFAFVVFGVASTSSVLPGEWLELFTLVVALSMALTPVMVIGAAAWARRRPQNPTRGPDLIEADDAPVIIAGFGRFGQVVGRLLFASGLKATVLDVDPDTVATLRRYGFRVFYGDPTRLDLLEQAGIARARVLVDAIDDVGANVALADLVRHHFPHVTIVGRARNVTHWFTLRRLGITRVEREVFEGSVRVGRHVLELLGTGPYEARERAVAFRRHNLAALEAILERDGDDASRTALAADANDNLEELFRRDVDRLRHHEGRSRRADAPDDDDDDDPHAAAPP
jgi:glutathione-regulated potassium-efflux system ancillary protein KefC